MRLGRFHGLVACGGFSYGDVLGAGEGWAKSILFNARGARRVRGFLRARGDLHPGRVQRLPNAVGAQGTDSGREGWPRFVRNRSEQYEARLALVRVPQSQFGAVGRHARIRCCPSWWRTARARPNSIPASSAASADRASAWSRCSTWTIAIGRREKYPFNPNGSALGLAGLCSADGRVTSVMPHPERVFRTRAELLGAEGVVGRRRLDAAVPQCAGVCRLAPRGLKPSRPRPDSARRICGRSWPAAGAPCARRFDTASRA